MTKGAEVAKDLRNPLARVHGMLHTALEGINPDVVGWMPAHLTKADLALGNATKSDGSLVTRRDVWANDVADKLAKLGVEYHRVPVEEVRRWKMAHDSANARAKWIGMATYAANNVPEYPFRDSEALSGIGGRTVEGHCWSKIACREETRHRWQEEERAEAREASGAC